MNFVTWGSLMAELLFLPLSVYKPFRAIMWLALSMMQINILLLLDIMDLTLGVLIFHFFVFDFQWLNLSLKKSHHLDSSQLELQQ